MMKTFFTICLLFFAYNALAENEITLAWDANTEPDLAGYNIYFGTVSRDYTEKIDVSNITEVTLKGFDVAITYYFAATVYDDDDNESAYSEELTHIWGDQFVNIPNNFRKQKK